MAAALLKMSQLVDLQVTGVDYFGAAQLAALTRLTGLRHLVVEAKEGQQLLESFNGDCVSLHSRVSYFVLVVTYMYLRVSACWGV